MAALAAGSTADTAIQREAKLRRVAILLSSLPAPLAAKMLGSIDPDSKQQLRRTMANLADVDPMERHRVVEAFRVSIGRVSSDRYSASSNGVDSFESSSPRSASNRYSSGSAASPVLKNAFPESSDADSDPSSPLAFLAEVDDQELADLLKEEHPQAVALVLASVPPEKAGRVLPRMSETLRTQALSRIGRLGEFPTQAAADMASHFRSRIDHPPRTKSTATGQRKLDAIIASMPTAAVVPNVATANPGQLPIQQPPVQQPTTQQPSVQHPSHLHRPAVEPKPEPTIRHDAIPSDAELAANELSHRLRVVSDDSETSALVDQVFTPEPTQATPQPDPFGSTDAIHACLVALGPIELCQSLGRVDMRDAMLCLCGLPNRVAEAALAMLPKDQAQTVRAQMNGLSALNLRDIDDAKERVARASMIATQARSSTSAAA